VVNYLDIPLVVRAPDVPVVLRIVVLKIVEAAACLLGTGKEQKHVRGDGIDQVPSNPRSRFEIESVESRVPWAYIVGKSFNGMKLVRRHLVCCHLQQGPD